MLAMGALEVSLDSFERGRLVCLDLLSWKRRSELRVVLVRAVMLPSIGLRETSNVYRGSGW